jgi:hypothetical protein
LVAAPYMLRERCANAHSGKLIPKRHLRNLRLLDVTFFFFQKFSDAYRKEVIKMWEVSNFSSVKAVFAFLFLGFGRLTCLPRDGQEELRQKCKSLPCN